MYFSVKEGKDSGELRAKAYDLGSQKGYRNLWPRDQTWDQYIDCIWRQFLQYNVIDNVQIGFEIFSDWFQKAYDIYCIE